MRIHSWHEDSTAGESKTYHCRALRVVLILCEDYKRPREELWIDVVRQNKPFPTSRIVYIPSKLQSRLSSAQYPYP